MFNLWQDVFLQSARDAVGPLLIIAQFNHKLRNIYVAYKAQVETSKPLRQHVEYDDSITIKS